MLSHIDPMEIKLKCRYYINLTCYYNEKTIRQYGAQLTGFHSRIVFHIQNTLFGCTFLENVG